MVDRSGRRASTTVYSSYQKSLFEAMYRLVPRKKTANSTAATPLHFSTDVPFSDSMRPTGVYHGDCCQLDGTKAMLPVVQMLAIRQRGNILGFEPSTRRAAHICTRALTQS